MKTIIGILIIAVMLSACGGTSGIAPEPSVDTRSETEPSVQVIKEPEFNEDKFLKSLDKLSYKHSLINGEMLKALREKGLTSNPIRLCDFQKKYTSLYEKQIDEYMKFNKTLKRVKNKTERSRFYNRISHSMRSIKDSMSAVNTDYGYDGLTACEKAELQKEFNK